MDKLTDYPKLIKRILIEYIELGSAHLKPYGPADLPNQQSGGK